MPHLFQKLPSLSALVAFEAAYRHGSFTRAADELALSQASVSRRIRELEEDMGVSLFERRRYDVEPTDHGERLARTTRPALNEIAETATQIRAVHTQVQTVTVFSDICLGSSLVAPVVGEFQQQHPETELRILASYDSIATTTADFDFGIQYGEWAPHRFEITPLLSEPLFPVCSPEVAKKLGKKPKPDDLLEFSLIHLAEVGKNWSEWGQVFEELGFDYSDDSEKLVFNSYQVCLDVAEKGDGIALGWAKTVEDKIARGDLVAIESMRVDLGDMINLYCPRDKNISSEAQSFLDLMLARINQSK